MGEGIMDLGRVVRIRLRGLLRSPGYTTVAVLTLSLGIGANAALYSVLDAVVLRPLPYEEPDRLVALLQQLGDEESRGFAPADIEYVRPRLESFEELAWYRNTESMTLTGLDRPEQIAGRRVSTEFFDVLGVEPLLGRGFRDGEDVEGRDGVVVLTHAFWTGRFAGDADILGRTLRIDDRPRTVVGVTGPDFRFDVGQGQDVFIPRVFDPESGNYTVWFSDNVVARLAPGVTLERADAETDRMAAALEEEFPTRRTDVPIRVMPLQESVVGDADAVLFALFAAVLLVLVVACANLAHLALARMSERSRDVALRRALGASGRRVLANQLLEAGLLSLLGLLGGLLLAGVALPLFTSLSPAEVPGLRSARLDGRVLLFATGVGVATTLVVGVLPALAVSGDLRGDLVGGGRASTGGGARLRAGLMVVETTVVTALLLPGGLLLSSLVNLLSVDPGFETEARTAVQLTVPTERYPTAPEIQDFFGRVVERLEALPGVVSVGGAATLPLSGEGITIPAPVPEGTELTGPAVATRPRTGWDAVTRGYFRTMGIPLVRGRTFDETDTAADSIPAIVVNRAFVRAVFGRDDPVGRRVGFGTPPSTWMRVVGVVADIRHDGLGSDGRLAFYQLAEQVTFAWPTMEIVLLADDGYSLPGSAIREAVWEVDPDQPVSRIRSLESVRRESLARERYQVLLTGGFALLALVLGAVGIYGVVGYATTRRIREFAVRLAVGATGSGIRTMVVRKTLTLVGLGVALGIGGGMLGGTLLRSWLHRVSPTDPLVVTAVAAILLATAVLAAYLPARRVSRTDPVAALRAE